MSSFQFPATIGSHHKWAAQNLEILIFTSGAPDSRVTAVQHFANDTVISLGLWLSLEHEAELLDILQKRAAERTEKGC